MKKVLAAALIAAITCTANAEIKFLTGPLAEAIRRAEQERKPVMIDFITDWCRWCDTLDARTYSNASVAEFINTSVVPIKIDAEKGEGIAIAKKYQVSGFPTILLITARGEEIDRILGYVPAEPFLSTMKGYMQGENTIGSLVARVKEHPDDARLRYSIAQKFTDRNDMESAAVHYKKLLELDPKDSLGHNEEGQYIVAASSLHSTKSASEMEKYIATYPRSPRIRQALATVTRFYIREKSGDKAKKYLEKYLDLWPTDAVMMNNFAWNCAEQQIDLDYASDVAKKAIRLARTSEEKASYVDTYATVRFVQGEVDEAITLEQTAIDLLKTVPNAKMKPYEESMTKFKAAKKRAMSE